MLSQFDVRLLLINIEAPSRNSNSPPPEAKGITSWFDRRNDVGLVLAGGAQKLPGPHQTLRNNIKDQGTDKELV